MSDYSTTGTSWTYKALADWAVNDWLRFRGGYNRAERAPNIGELFLAAQQTFGVNNRGDVCSHAQPDRVLGQPGSQRGATRGDVQAVCRALMNAGRVRTRSTSTTVPGSPPPQSAGRLRLRVPDPGRQPEPGAGNGRHLDRRRGDPVAGRRAARCRACGCRSTGTTSRSRTRSAPRRSARCSSSASIRCSTRWSPAPASPASTGRRRPTRRRSPLRRTRSASCVPRNRAPAQLGNVHHRPTPTPAGCICRASTPSSTGASTSVRARYARTACSTTRCDFESSALYPQIPLVDYVGTHGHRRERPEPERVRVSRASTTLGYSWDACRVGLQWQYYPSLEDGGEAAVPRAARRTRRRGRTTTSSTSTRATS